MWSPVQGGKNRGSLIDLIMLLEPCWIFLSAVPQEAEDKPALQLATEKKAKEDINPVYFIIIPFGLLLNEKSGLRGRQIIELQNTTHLLCILVFETLVRRCTFLPRKQK